MDMFEKEVGNLKRKIKNNNAKCKISVKKPKLCQSLIYLSCKQAYLPAGRLF